MEYELLEHCVMGLADSLRRWMMHRVSSFIKTKWYNQNTPTRDTHLDKVIAAHFCLSLKLIFCALSLLSCTSPLTSWLLANTMIWFSMLTLLTQGEDLDTVFLFIKLNFSRLSLYEQIGHKFPHLAQSRLTHGFHVAHRLDFSTVSLELWSDNM